MSITFDLEFPASSANLGPGFDVAALALGFGLRVRATLADAWRIAARGRDAAACENLDRHLIVDTYRSVLGDGAPPLALELDNAIPLGRGCGSSAAARLAGVALAARFGRLGWTSEQVFEAAARSEGHPDNVAACWFGGLVLASEPRIVLANLVPWSLLVAVAAEPLATERARAVLPLQVSYADAVFNMKNLGLLVQAWRDGRGDWLATAMRDRLHQPYRASLCPLLPALEPLAGQEGILGVALSGAGPSVLMVVDDTARARSAAVRTLAASGLKAELLATEPALRGPGQDWIS